MATVPARTRYVFGVQRDAMSRFEIAVLELDGGEKVLPLFSSQEEALSFAESMPGFPSEGEASGVGFAPLELLYALVGNEALAIPFGIEDPSPGGALRSVLPITTLLKRLVMEGAGTPEVDRGAVFSTVS